MGIELAKAFVTIGADSTGASAAFQQIERSAEQSMGNIKRIMTSVLGAIGSYMGASTIWKGLAYAGEFEETKVAFETMIGTVEETEKTLADLTEFAAKTPFEMPGIQQVARGLLTFGERGDDMMDTLKVLGDASGGTAVNFQMLGMVFNQVRGVGKLLTQDFRQLSTRGILFLTDIAKYYKVTEAEASSMLSKGKIAFSDVKEILRQTTMEGGRNFNMMERQSKTYKGLMSTLSDNIGLTFRAIGEGILPVSRNVVRMMDKVVNSIREVVVASGSAAGNIVGATTAVIGLTTAIMSARVAMKMMGLTFKQVLIGTGAGIALIALGVAIGLVVTGVQKLWKWLTSLVPVQQAMARMAERLSVAWQIFKTTMVTIGSAIWTALKQIGEVILNYFGVSLEDLPGTAGEVFASILDTVSGFVVKAASWFGAIVENWEGVWPVVKEAAAVGWQAIVERASWAWGQIGVHARAAMAGLEAVFVYVAGHWKDILAAMVDVALLNFTAIVKGIAAALNAIDWSKLGAAFGNLMKTWAAHQWGMISGLAEVFSWLMDSWKDVLTRMLNAWKAYSSALPKALYAAIKSLATGGTIGSAFSAAIEAGMSGIGTAMGEAFSVGAEAGQKFSDGYSAGVQEAKDMLGVDQGVWESLGEIGAQAYTAATAAASAVMKEADEKITRLKDEMIGLAEAYSAAQQQALADEDLTFAESENLAAMRERLAGMTAELQEKIKSTQDRLEQEAKDALKTGEKTEEEKKKEKKKEEEEAGKGKAGTTSGFVQFGEKIQEMIFKASEGAKTNDLLEKGNELTEQLPERIAGAMAAGKAAGAPVTAASLIAGAKKAKADFDKIVRGTSPVATIASRAAARAAMMPDFEMGGISSEMVTPSIGASRISSLDAAAAFRSLTPADLATLPGLGGGINAYAAAAAFHSLTPADLGTIPGLSGTADFDNAFKPVVKALQDGNKKTDEVVKAIKNQPKGGLL